MLRFFTLALLSFVLHLPAGAQVKQEYLYNTNMPYGTLDIRTSISATRFYYIEEGETFSFRESAPGIRTHNFLDMTPWDSSPYEEGNLRKKDGSKDDFVMNYRLLPPLNYVSSYDEGYPLIVFMHGAAERGNCYYDACYHADWNYNPNIHLPSFKGQHLNIKLVDMLGHVLHSREYSAGDLFDAQYIRISLPLEDGIYILILKNGGQAVRRRVMVRH